MSDDHPTLSGFVSLPETAFMHVFENRDLRVILGERKQGAPMGAEDVEPAHRELTTLGDDTKGWGLIIDTRLVTGNSDERFEAAVSRSNAVLLAHFERVVVLVRSAIGKLQATRITGLSDQILVTTEVEAGLEFLAQSSAPDPGDPSR
ncbi:hypothetical protein DB30_02922 [Enhygromyxa salina]|uniref:Uncharacterized protein n=1 Tax=Enhygromyxa salina TaxID=215803 RepID=A0A0C2DD70_9BACT|nr:hypothetical protein [Enhygromyxa salina]KIG17647.1 hypothetical protein DB30_02922 [Enhygromyxa salina]